MIKSQINLYLLHIQKIPDKISNRVLSLSKDELKPPNAIIDNENLKIKDYISSLVTKYIDINPDLIIPILYEAEIYNGIIHINYAAWIRQEYIQPDSNLFSLDMANFTNDPNIQKLTRFL